MNTEQLLREVLERDAGSQPYGLDLHARSVAGGRRRIQRRRAAWVGGLAALLVAALVPSLGIGRRSTAPAEPPVEPTLESLAAHVRALPPEPVHTTGAWYVERLNADAVNDGAGRSDQWWLPNGLERVVAAGQEVMSTAPALTWEAVQELPKEPAALAAKLQVITPFDVGPGQPDLQLMANAEDLLTYTPAGPALRAEILEALALDKVIHVEGFVQDPLHRQALAVSMTVTDPGDPSQKETIRIVLSTETGRVVRDADVVYVATQWVPDDHTYPSGIPPQPLAPSS
jgi:hypothetical protein